MSLLNGFGGGSGGGGGPVTINTTVQEITASGLSEDAGQVLVEGNDGGALLTGDGIRIALDTTLGSTGWRAAAAERLMSYDVPSRTVSILGGTGVALPLASPSAAGLMSAADKQALDAGVSGGGGGGPQVLTYDVPSRTVGIVGGTGVALPVATLSAAGLMSAADKQALAAAGGGAGGPDPRTVTVVEKTGSATLAASEAFALLRVDSAAPVVITIPAGALAVGEQVSLLQAGTGAVTVAAGPGVTVASEVGLLLRGRHAIASLICVGPDSHVLVGALAA